MISNKGREVPTDAAGRAKPVHKGGRRRQRFDSSPALLFDSGLTRPARSQR